LEAVPAREKDVKNVVAKLSKMSTVTIRDPDAKGDPTRNSIVSLGPTCGSK
jgi:hypothetical protein